MEFDILSVSLDSDIDPIFIYHCHRHSVAVLFIVADDSGRSPSITTIFRFNYRDILICQSFFIIWGFVCEINLHCTIRKFQDTWFITATEDIPIPYLGFIYVSNSCPGLANVVGRGNCYGIRRLRALVFRRPYIRSINDSSRAVRIRVTELCKLSIGNIDGTGAE